MQKNKIDNLTKKALEIIVLDAWANCIGAVPRSKLSVLKKLREEKVILRDYSAEVIYKIMDSLVEKELLEERDGKYFFTQKGIRYISE